MISFKRTVIGLTVLMILLIGCPFLIACGVIVGFVVAVINFWDEYQNEEY